MSELQPTGVLNLDKPAGISSAGAVTRVKRLLPRGIRVGHAGTLDPFATGVLLILVGKATRLSEKLMDGAKEYVAEITFGGTTATDDLDSEVVPTPGAVSPAYETIVEKLAEFRGTIMQRPPDYSAMKIGGRRAYDLARNGTAPALQPRPVRIDWVEIISYNWPRLTVRIGCGRGTYIRAIARDLGAGLGVGGYLTQLRRTAVGPFRVETAIQLDDLLAAGPTALTALLRQLPPSL